MTAKTKDPLDEITETLRSRVGELETELNTTNQELASVNTDLAAAVTRRDEAATEGRRKGQARGVTIGKSPEAVARQQEAARDEAADQQRRIDSQAACDALSVRRNEITKRLTELTEQWRPLRRQVDDIDAAAPLEPIQAEAAAAQAALNELLQEQAGIDERIAEARSKYDAATMMSLQMRARDLPAGVLSARLGVTNVNMRLAEAMSHACGPELALISADLEEIDAELAEVQQRRDAVQALHQQAVARQQGFRGRLTSLRNEAKRLDRELDRSLAR